MPKFVLDKKEIEFTQGETIMQAGVRNGIDIPNFCWHPSLSVSGNCRICLVEIEKMPKLAIACATLAADGMVVHTSSQKALAARNAVMNFCLSIILLIVLYVMKQVNVNCRITLMPTVPVKADLQRRRFIKIKEFH